MILYDVCQFIMNTYVDKRTHLCYTCNGNNSNRVVISSENCFRGNCMDLNKTIKHQNIFICILSVMFILSVSILILLIAINHYFGIKNDDFMCQYSHRDYVEYESTPESIRIDKDASVLDIQISNSKNNSYYLMAKIYTQSGDLLYKSPLLKPGEVLSSIDISPIKQGSLHVVLVYEAYELCCQKYVSSRNFEFVIISE